MSKSAATKKAASSAALSGDEVAAMIDGLSEHAASAGNAADPAARPYMFGNEAIPPMPMLPAVDRLSVRMARKMRDAIEPFARDKPGVEAERVTVRRFESWRVEQPEFSSISLYRFRPLKGAVLIAIEPSFVSRLVDIFYGGSGEYDERKFNEFTATEERLLTRLSEALIDTLTEVWSEVMTVTPQLMSRETNTAYASLVRGDEPVAVARFTISLGVGRSSRIEILYPVSALRSVENELSSKVHDDNSKTARERMATALGEVRIQARSVLARPSISVAELLALEPGDVIPISLPPQVPLLVSGRLLGFGAIGDQEGRAALKIEKIDRSYVR
jgi:flagellar motor switch protein FliM